MTAVNIRVLHQVLSLVLPKIKNLQQTFVGLAVLSESPSLLDALDDGCDVIRNLNLRCSGTFRCVGERLNDLQFYDSPVCEWSTLIAPLEQPHVDAPNVCFVLVLGLYDAAEPKIEGQFEI